MWKFFAVFICCFSSVNVLASYQPEYQVKVLIQKSIREDHQHLCNGVIVQASLILTTANCLQRNNNSLYAPTDILIEAGSADSEQEVFLAKAKNIFLQAQFNISQINNSLALINLSMPLPFASRKDIQWIILDDLGLKNGTGFAFFTYSNCFNKWPGTLQFTQIPMMTGMACNSTQSATICSLYQLPNDLKCHQLNEYLIGFGDLGTGLVKNNRLVGLLAAISPFEAALPRQKRLYDCSHLKVKAIYISIAYHANWIYEIIANQEYIDVIYGHHQFSTPYQMSADQRPLITGKCVTTKRPSHESENSEEIDTVEEVLSNLEVNLAISRKLSKFLILICFIHLNFFL